MFTRLPKRWQIVHDHTSAAKEQYISRSTLVPLVQQSATRELRSAVCPAKLSRFVPAPYRQPLQLRPRPGGRIPRLKLSGRYFNRGCCATDESCDSTLSSPSSFWYYGVKRCETQCAAAGIERD